MVTSATNDAALVHGPVAVGACVGPSDTGTVGVLGDVLGAAVGVSVAGAVVGGGAAVAVGLGVWQADTKTIRPRHMNAIPFFISAPLSEIQFGIVCIHEQALGVGQIIRLPADL